MATKAMTTRDAGKSTTSLSSVNPSIPAIPPHGILSSTSKTTELFDEGLITKLANSAFADRGKAEDMIGNATNRLVWSILAAWHNHKIEVGDESLTPLSAVIVKTNSGKRSEAWNTVHEYMTERFITPLKDDAKDDEKAEHNTRLRNKRTMLNTALKVAGILDSRSIGTDQYNMDKGMFPVPTDLLLKKGEEPANFLLTGGRSMAQGHRPITLVLLDNKSYQATVPSKTGGAGRTMNFRASGARLVECYDSHHATPRRKPVVAGGTENKADERSSNIGIDTLISELHANLYQGDTPAGTGADGIPDDKWNLFVAVSRWIAEGQVIRDRAANKPVSKPVSRNEAIIAERNAAGKAQPPRKAAA